MYTETGEETVLEYTGIEITF